MEHLWWNLQDSRIIVIPTRYFYRWTISRFWLYNMMYFGMHSSPLWNLFRIRRHKSSGTYSCGFGGEGCIEKHTLFLLYGLLFFPFPHKPYPMHLSALPPDASQPSLILGEVAYTASNTAKPCFSTDICSTQNHCTVEPMKRKNKRTGQNLHKVHFNKTDKDV